jgi:hypothetical protein
VSTDDVIHNDNNPRGLFSLCQYVAAAWFEDSAARKS